jgi:hypothetical protein
MFDLTRSVISSEKCIDPIRPQFGFRSRDVAGSDPAEIAQSPSRISDVPFIRFPFIRFIRPWTMQTADRLGLRYSLRSRGRPPSAGPKDLPFPPDPHNK